MGNERRLGEGDLDARSIANIGLNWIAGEIAAVLHEKLLLVQIDSSYFPQQYCYFRFCIP